MSSMLLAKVIGWPLLIFAVFYKSSNEVRPILFCVVKVVVSQIRMHQLYFRYSPCIQKLYRPCDNCLWHIWILVEIPCIGQFFVLDYFLYLASHCMDVTNVRPTIFQHPSASNLWLKNCSFA